MSKVLYWEQCKVTWWLYSEGKPLTSVRAHVTATPNQVRAKALAELTAMPCLAYPRYLPFEMAERIMAAQVTL